MSTEFFNDQWRIPSNENQNKISNYSMEFDGTSSYIDATISALDNANSITFSGWFKKTSGNVVGFESFVSTTDRIILYWWSDNNVYWSVRNGSESSAASSALTIYDWNHIVGTFDGTTNTIKLYINGSLVDTQTGQPSSTSANLSNNFHIGLSDGSTYNNGKIDQVNIFDYALSQDQVTQLGAEGYAFKFNGTSERIDFGDVNGYDITDKFSGSCWAYLTASGSDFILGKEQPSSPYQGYLLYRENSGKLNFIMAPSYASDYFGVKTTSSVPFNTWTHLAFTYDGSANRTGLKLYIDGTLQAVSYTGNATVLGSMLNSSVPFQISGRGGSATNGVDGEVSNVSIFNTELSSPQVTTLYNNGKPGDISSLNPTAWYKLDDTEVFNTTSTEWSVDNNAYPSAYKSSLNFSGSGQYLQVPDSNDFSFGNGTTDSPFSLSAWINPDAVEAAGIVAKYVSGIYEWLFYIEGSNLLRLLLLSDNNAGNSIALTTDVAIPINTWTHVSATYNANEQAEGISLYINGSLQSLVTERLIGTYVAMTNTTAPVQIGTWGGTFRPINGQVSNVSIWDAELTETQVAEIYNNGTPSNLLSHSTTSNLISWWELNNTNTGIQDSKGSNNASNIGTTKYDGFVNALAGESVGMDVSNLVASNINGELIANPMITSPKPIAYYQLGDQSVDNGANLLVPNNSLSDFVFNFDGTNDYIDAGNITALNSQSAFSTSTWINYSGTLSTSHIFLSGGIVQSNRFYIQLLSSTQIRYGSASAFDNVTVSTISSGSWHHIVTVHNGTSLDVYLDGVKQNSSPVTVVAPNTNIGDDFTIGRYNISSGYYWNGELSNISVFNTALSIGNIETLYNNGAPGDISSLNPTAWYKLNASEIFNSTSTEWSVDNNAYPSVYKSSLDFDSDSISCGNTLGSGYSLISVSSWVNFDNPNSNVREEIISKDDGSSNRTFFLVKFENSDWAAYGTIGFAINDGTTTSNATVSQADFTPSANTWYNILGTWDGTNIKLYINGVLKKTTAFSASNLDTNTVNVLIGDSSASGTYFLNGQISNTAIWNTALTAPQVTTIYNNGTPEASISHSPVSWWKLDNTTTGIQDSAGSNNGTNNGATEYAGFVNGLAGESSGMGSSNLVVSDLQQTSGYSPYALSLDPNDANQLILNNGGNAILNGATSLTVSAWINPTADTGTFQNIFTNWTGNIMIRFNNTEALQVYLNSVSPSFIGTANGTITFGEWQHIVVTYSGSEVKIYRNNILKSSAAATGTLGTSASADIIGNRRSTTQFFNGKMSNVAVWKNSVIDVNTLYNQGLPADLTSLSPTGWWQLGSNSSFNSGIWTSLNQGIGSTSLVPANATSSGAMTNDDITNGPGYSAMGLGNSSIEIKGDAPYSTANGLSENMDVLDRVKDVPS